MSASGPILKTFLFHYLYFLKNFWISEFFFFFFTLRNFQEVKISLRTELNVTKMSNHVSVSTKTLNVSAKIWSFVNFFEMDCESTPFKDIDLSLSVEATNYNDQWNFLNSIDIFPPWLANTEHFFSCFVWEPKRFIYLVVLGNLIKQKHFPSRRSNTTGFLSIRRWLLPYVV